MTRVIGVSGLARSGKDSFYFLAKEKLKSRGINSCRLAFADELKNECDEFLKNNLGISSFTEDNSEKELIRPFLVTYGTHLRRKIDPNCWINKLNEKIQDKQEQKKVIFITDVRFENEIDWVHSLGGKAVHITRNGITAPNQEEADNDPILKGKSDFFVEWLDFDSQKDNELSNIIDEALQSIL